MFFRTLSISTALFAILLTGCATQTKMAFSDESNSTIKPDKAVYLMTATIKNSYKTSHQPKLIVVNVEKRLASGSSDRLNFKIDDNGKIESDTPEGSTYLLRMELEKGDYVILGLSSMSSSFPFHGFYFTPIHENLVSSGSGVFYLGHIEANVRERQGEEFKAGPSVPLVDQAVAGASTGTFDVAISDQWATDEAKFKGKFPVLVNTPITKTILPPFDRVKAQQWWEAH